MAKLNQQKGNAAILNAASARPFSPENDVGTPRMRSMARNTKKTRQNMAK
jgi:hypothetical protein